MRRNNKWKGAKFVREEAQKVIAKLQLVTGGNWMVYLVFAERIEIWKIGFWFCILKILGGASIE